MSKINLRDIAKIAVTKVRINVETIEETSVTNRDGVPYYRAQLDEPVMVRVSTKPSEQPIEMTEVHFLQPLLDKEWQCDDDDKGNPLVNNGAFLTTDDGKEYVIDFSVGQEFAIYQDEYIQQWIRGNRKAEGAARNNEKSSVMAKLRAKQNEIKPVETK